MIRYGDWIDPNGAVVLQISDHWRLEQVSCRHKGYLIHDSDCIDTDHIVIAIPLTEVFKTVRQ